VTARRTRLTVRHDIGWSVHVAHHGQDLLTYVYAPDDVQLESPRPYFHPLHTLGGDLVSLFRPHDHVWHKGIAWSLPDLGPHNFWGGPNYVHGQGYVQLDNNGSMDHQRFSALDVTDDRVQVSQRGGDRARGTCLRSDRTRPRRLGADVLLGDHQRLR
jgi:Methane oxygenase PmoA